MRLRVVRNLPRGLLVILLSDHRVNRFKGPPGCVGFTCVLEPSQVFCARDFVDAELIGVIVAQLNVHENVPAASEVRHKVDEADFGSVGAGARHGRSITTQRDTKFGPAEHRFSEEGGPDRHAVDATDEYEGLTSREHGRDGRGIAVRRGIHGGAAWFVCREPCLDAVGVPGAVHGGVRRDDAVVDPRIVPLGACLRAGTHDALKRGIGRDGESSRPQRTTQRTRDMEVGGRRLRTLRIAWGIQRHDRSGIRREPLDPSAAWIGHRECALAVRVEQCLDDLCFPTVHLDGA